VTEVGGNLVISWPSSAAGYSLESTTDLSQNNWNPVPQSPAVVGDFNVVTNTTDGQATFYRLHKL
jgi:hypothetical protein